MARTVKDANLGTAEARRRLKVQGKPHYRTLEEGLHLGYRRTRDGAGRWVARFYASDNGGYETETFALADDLSDANAVSVLSFSQAQAKVREMRDERDRHAAGKSVGPFTIGAALDLYLEFLDGDDRTPEALAATRYAIEARIRPTLGKVEASALTTDTLRKWRNALVKAPARVRTRKGEMQKHRNVGTDETALRRRRSTARRIWNVLRAALNHAYRAGLISSDVAWKRLEAIKAADEARVRYLSIAEAQRLINGCSPDFRPLVEAALLTGARYGALCGLKASDFNPDSSTLTMRSRKGKGAVKTYHVHLTAEGVGFFKAACARCGGARDFVFRKAGGEPWKKSQQKQPIKDASVRAGINPPVNFHVTRHTWASHAVMNGMSLMAVAQNLGHADTKMVQAHYGHLSPGYRQSQVREFAPTFGIDPDVAMIR